MSRRTTGILAAIALALIGTVTLAAYVSSAEARALAGEDLVEVYVVNAQVPSGTAAADIEDAVTLQQVPAKIKVQNAVENLGALAGMVTAVELFPGEQLVTGRFVVRSEFSERATGIEVPEEMVEVTIELDTHRANGGLLEPGQTVAVLASFDPFGITRTVIPVDGEAVPVPAAVAEDVEGNTPNSTSLLLRKVLVTAVQSQTAFEPVDDEQRIDTAPAGPIFVTFAVSPFDAERLIFTAEFGQVWLAIERETVPDTGGPGQTRGSVLLGSETPGSDALLGSETRESELSENGSADR